MDVKNTGRSGAAVTLSVVVHLSVAFVLMALPAHLKQARETVDMELVEKKREAEPEPELPPLPEQPVKQIAKKLLQKKTEPPPEPEPPPETEPPPEPEPPPDVPEAPPVFDLGDNTFAQNGGQGASWHLARSEGNTKFGAMAKPGDKGVRNTTPVREEPTSVADTFKPVPQKDWSRRPEISGAPLDTSALYTYEARRAGIEGKLRMQLFIGRDGTVRRARVIDDPGYGLAAKAVEAALKMKWQPALDKDGKAVDTVIVYTITYILDN